VTARKKKILVVDDDAGIRESLQVLLNTWGFEVLQAPDAMQATEIYTLSLHDALPICLWRWHSIIFKL